MAEPPVAFVIGCARSGTTIVGDLIAAHPGARGVFEAHDVWPETGDSHRLTEADATDERRRELRAWARGELGDAQLLVEKNPRHSLRVPFLRAVFPHARFVHVVRDGRDVAWSLVPGLGGEEWAHMKPPGWRALMARARGAERGALAWREVLEIALGDLAGTDHLTVRYEDLVASPRDEAERIRAYLGLGPSPGYERFTDRIQDSTAHPPAPASAIWGTSGHAVRVGRWREHAGTHPAESRAVEQAVAPMLGRLGYEPRDAPGTRQPPPLVITGAPGSGTRVFQRIVRHAGLFMGADVNEEGDSRPIGRWGKRWLRPYSHARLRGHEPAGHDEMVSHFWASESAHLAGVEDPAAPWGWKVPRSLFTLPFIHERHPGMRFLHVLRDGRDFASTRNWGVLNHEDIFLSPTALAKPLGVRNVLLWEQLNVLAADYAERELGERYLALRLEDLCASPERVIRRIMAFAGVPGDPTPPMLAEVRRPDSLGRWRRLDAETGAEITRAVARGLRRFGYLA
jgi:sulfotransferase family protein